MLTPPLLYAQRRQVESFERVMKEPGEQCTVVIALIVPGPTGIGERYKKPYKIYVKQRKYWTNSVITLFQSFFWGNGEGMWVDLRPLYCTAGLLTDMVFKDDMNDFSSSSGNWLMVPAQEKIVRQARNKANCGKGPCSTVRWRTAVKKPCLIDSWFWQTADT